MAERQLHGFTFEQAIIKEMNITPTKNYTDEWDGMYGEIPVSIKCIKNGSDIDMADYFRNSNKNKDFILIVGFWENDGNNIVNTHYLFIPAEEWRLMFPLEFAEKFKNLLTGITNSHEDDERWKEEINELKKEWKDKTNNLIRPRFKRDHKSQKRIQCAINYNDFYNYFLKKYEINWGEFSGKRN